MNITWLIGNGFDLNLGMRTSYKSFISEAYLSENENQWSEAKRTLVERAGGLSKTELWSDLEALLGAVSENYDAADENEIELFHEGWEGLLEELEAYLVKEDDEFLKVGLSKEEVEEFWDSIVHLGSRLKAKDADVVDVFSRSPYNHRYAFVTLNYTHTIDIFLKDAKKAHSPFNERVVVGTYRDSAGDPMHVHGVLAPDGRGEIVMGLSEPAQIANAHLASSEDALQLWLKERRNDFYRNRRNEQLKRSIDDSDVIVIYGCSLGESDVYIWKQICDWVMGSAARRLLVLDHGVPPSGTCHLREFQKARKAIISKFASYGGGTGDQIAILEERMVVENSDVVFAFGRWPGPDPFAD